MISAGQAAGPQEIRAGQRVPVAVEVGLDDGSR